MKNQKGITLIALVITIIVLLILAGVSIAMLTGQNGVLSQASNAQTKTREAQITEAVRLAVTTINADILDGETGTYSALNYASIAAAINASEGAGTATEASGGITYKYGTTNYTATFTITTVTSGAGSIGDITISQ